MLENKKDQKVYTRKSLVLHFICTTVPVLTFQYHAKKSYRLPTQMKTAAWKNDPVEKLCNQRVKSIVWKKEKSESPEGIESMTFRTRVWCSQRAEKVVSDSPGASDVLWGIWITEEQKKFLGLVEMTSGLVNARMASCKHDFLCTLCSNHWTTKDSWRAGPYTRFMYDMRPDRMPK